MVSFSESFSLRSFFGDEYLGIEKEFWNHQHIGVIIQFKHSVSVFREIDVNRSEFHDFILLLFGVVIFLSRKFQRVLIILFVSQSECNFWTFVQ